MPQMPTPSEATPRAADDPSTELFKLLDEEVSYFDDNATQLLSPQLESFSTISKIMSEIDEEKITKQRKADRIRIRSVMTDVLLMLGPEMFLLCAVALPISRLLSVKHRMLFKILRDWWNISPRPRGLTTTAVRFCGAVQDRVSRSRKRKIEELGIDGESLLGYA